MAPTETVTEGPIEVDTLTIRVIAETAGADFSLEYVRTSEQERRRRATTRWLQAPHTTFEMTEADHDRYRASFEPPSRNELVNGPVPAPPPGHDTWPEWASWRWPTLPVITSMATPD
ncbi:MAG TPA: hypothetical protein VGN48_15435 [Pedococcus sp.]|jgi:hypothetical protein|nr:hypothetical protein [Pedococcus sp.]